MALSILAGACTGAESEPPLGNGDARDTLTAQAVPGDQSDFPASLRSDWSTNFSKASVSSKELSRGQVKDGIPAISQPKFLSVEETGFLGEKEPVVAFELDGDARAYPLQILIWHEIVNDVVAGKPVLITFCPLCNTANRLRPRRLRPSAGVWRFRLPAQ